MERKQIIGRTVLRLPTVDSTNSEGKRRAEAGAEEGLVILADAQTGGRGRRGRAFQSPAGKGLYLSVLLRPQCQMEELMWLTAWTAVAVCGGIEAACGIRPGIKWTNDILLDGRKLCGILTELGLKGGRVDYAVVGVGVNLTQTEADFGPGLAPAAVSLAQALGGTQTLGETGGKVPDRDALAEALIRALDEMYAAFPREKARYLAQYRADCLTTGREVRLLHPHGAEAAYAEEIDDSFALVVRHPDGRRETVTAGEVSVRGLLGYAD